MAGCWDTKNESLNNWEMLSNKGVGTADQWERGTATWQPITTLLIFWCGRSDTHFFGRPDRKLFLTSVPIIPWIV